MFNFLRGLASLALLVGLALLVSGQVSIGSSTSKGGLPFMKPTHAKAEKSTTKFDDVKGCDEAVILSSLFDSFLTQCCCFLFF